MSPKSRLKWIVVPLALGLGAAGGLVATRMNGSRSPEDSDRARNLESVPPGFFDVAPFATKDDSGPPPVKPGQILVIEVLEALPGRPITGDHIVRPDGTISLGFYGDVHVAGLNRAQIKVKLIEHLREFINDETLGLLAPGPDGSPNKPAPPINSTRIFVDDSVYPPTERAGDRKPAAGTDDPLVSKLSAQIDELNSKLDRVLKELEQLRSERTLARPADAPPAPPPDGQAPG